MTTGKALKKLSAILAGIMMFGASANAMVLEENYLYENSINKMDWTYSSSSGAPVIRTDLTIKDGKIAYSGLRSSYAYSDMATFYKNVKRKSGDTEIDNDIDTGIVKASVTVNPSTDKAFVNNHDAVRYTIGLNDEDGSNVAKFEFAKNYLDSYINGVQVAPGQNKVMFNVGVDTVIDLVVDYDEGICYPMLNGERIQTGIEGEEPVYASIGSQKPVTKISIAPTCSTGSGRYINQDAMLFDNISFYSSDFDEYLINDTFDDETKTTVADYGYNMENGCYVYRTANGFYLLNGTESTTTYTAKRSFEAVESGKLVVEVTLENYDNDGTRRKLYGSSGAPIISINSGDTARAYVHGGGANLGYLSFNEERIDTNIGSQPFASDYFKDLRLIADIDEGTYNLYAKNPYTGDYTLVNETVATMAAGTGIDSVSFASHYFRGTMKIENLKIYTIQDGYTTPVIMTDGRNTVTEIKAGNTVDIYSAGYNTENAKLIVTYFDETGKFINCDIKDFTAATATESETILTGVELLKTSYTFPETAAAGCKFKAFVWNGLDDMVPLTASAEIEMPEAETAE